MTTDRNSEYLAGLVQELCKLPRETEWLEFKVNNADPQEIGEYLSALANEASLCNQPRGYLVFGIDDASHEVVGTRFDPYAAKAKGNQDLLPWLGALLQPNSGVEVLSVDYPSGRVVMLAVGPARDRPVAFSGRAYCRAGTSKTELSRHPEKERALWTRGSDWSAEPCDGASLSDLNPEALGIHWFKPLLSPVDICSFSKGFGQWISKGPRHREFVPPKLMQYLPFWAAAMQEGRK